VVSSNGGNNLRDQAIEGALHQQLISSLKTVDKIDVSQSNKVVNFVVNGNV
jgi:hypothetical protein